MAITLLLLIGMAALALLAVTSPNPVHNILHLVSVFLLGGAILVAEQLDFLGLIYIIVYVGAIAVLFLFIVMLLNIQLVELEDTYIRYVPVGLTTIFLFFLLSYSLLASTDIMCFPDAPFAYHSWITHIYQNHTALILGQLLYEKHGIYLLLVGLLLLVAMLGCIALTIHYHSDTKQQHMMSQIKHLSNVVLTTNFFIQIFSYSTRGTTEKCGSYRPSYTLRIDVD